MNLFFGALDKRSCLYFYLMSTAALGLVVLIVLYMIYHILTRSKKMNAMMIANFTVVSLHLTVAYFVNRLLHTICIKSLN
jgi:hypothetical protein